MRIVKLPEFTKASDLYHYEAYSAMKNSYSIMQVISVIIVLITG